MRYSHLVLELDGIFPLSHDCRLRSHVSYNSTEKFRINAKFKSECPSHVSQLSSDDYIIQTSTIVHIFWIEIKRGNVFRTVPIIVTIQLSHIHDFMIENDR